MMFMSNMVDCLQVVRIYIFMKEIKVYIYTSHIVIFFKTGNNNFINKIKYALYAFIACWKPQHSLWEFLSRWKPLTVFWVSPDLLSNSPKCWPWVFTRLWRHGEHVLFLKWITENRHWFYWIRPLLLKNMENITSSSYR